MQPDHFKVRSYPDVHANADPFAAGTPATTMGHYRYGPNDLATESANGPDFEKAREGPLLVSRPEL